MAGYPFFVMPILNFVKTIKGEPYDLRFVIYQKINYTGNSTIHTIPLLMKKWHQKIKEESIKNSDFFPTNVFIIYIRVSPIQIICKH